MKVLFVCSANSKYGIIPFVKAQGESLIKNGISLEFFTIDSKGILGYMKNLHKLKKKIKQNHYDLIHAHYGLCGILSQIARRKEKLVVSLMGDDLLGSPDKDGKISILSKVISKCVTFFAEKRFDFVIVKSQNLKKKLHITNVEIVPNGVDFEIFKVMDRQDIRKRVQIDADKKIVLFPVDPNIPRKNYPLAWKAIQLLEDEDIELKVIHGIDQKSLVNYYNAADVVLITSYLEGSPNVIKEAMACDCKIVSTDVGDVKEVIGDAAGCYVTTYNAEDVAKCIDNALSFDQPRNGRTSVRHLEISRIAQKIYDLYQQVLEV